MRILSLAKPAILTDLKRPSVLPVAALLVLSALAGCAFKGSSQWEKDKPELLESIQQVQAENSELKTRVESLEQQILELETNLKKQEADNTALSSSIKSLKKSGNKKNGPDGTSDKDQKLVRKLEKIETSIRTATGSGTPVIQPSDNSIEKNSYTAAYLALKSGRYEEASAGFRELLKENPKGEYADQAWFWLGESYYALKKNKEAIDAFNKVAADFPDSAKHPAALLKLAMAYQESGRKSDARAALQKLIKQHTETNAAEQARDMLKKMDSEQKK